MDLLGLAKKLRRNLLALTILQGLALLGYLFVAIYSPELLFDSVFEAVLGLAPTVYIVVATIHNITKLKAQKPLSPVPYYLFVGLTVFTIAMKLGHSVISGLAINVIMIVWLIYIIRWIKQYGELLAANKEE